MRAPSLKMAAARVVTAAAYISIQLVFGQGAHFGQVPDSEQNIGATTAAADQRQRADITCGLGGLSADGAKPIQ